MDRLSVRTAIKLTPRDVERYLESLYEQFQDKENEELIKPLVQQFVANVTVFENEIKVDLKIVLVTIGGGGPHVHVCTVFNNTALCLYYLDPRPCTK